MQALIGLDPTAIALATDVPAFRLGSMGAYDDPVQGTKVYIYGVALSGITQFFTCVEATNNANFSMITTANTAAGQAGGHGSRVGVAQATLTAGQFGWFQIAGAATINTLASAALGTRLNTTATAGSLDDDGTAASRAINGVVLKVATAGAQANNTTARLSFPTVGVTL